MIQHELRNTYARKAISQIPRLLGNMDRNPYSPTYGCFHRDYWLDKTSDFPDAVRQFGVHALALVYKYDFPGNRYKGNPKVREWTIAAMSFWAAIQHKDGSFDEFYPYERGWVGPTAFTAYTIMESYTLLKEEMPADVKNNILHAIIKAAHFIAKGETEEDHLANHHAMACLALWKAYELLGDEKLNKAYDKAWQTFLTYHNVEEGWSREYDGTDPGYLSATVSFLGKVYQTNPSDEILNVLKQSVAFSSYFVYPNGYYAGSTGSRNTLHFYPHGYEILAKEIPLAGAVAEKMLEGLSEDKLVPPEIISDRYVFYRVPEFLLAYLDYQRDENQQASLPFQEAGLERYFEQAGIYVKTTGKHYILVNLAKGGVIKVFDLAGGRLMYNDCGIIGRLTNGKVVTTQWVDPDYQVKYSKGMLVVSGNFNYVPSNKLFTPLKNIIFRTTLMLLGWYPPFAHFLKGQIRKALILGQRKAPVTFKRSIQPEDDKLKLYDEIQLTGEETFTSLSFGDEFFVRYVPQSRYFQAQELEVEGHTLAAGELEELNRQKAYTREVPVF